MQLENKSAIVTGSASGIGREVALTLATHGASVTVADRNLEGAESVARQITESGGSGDGGAGRRHKQRGRSAPWWMPQSLPTAQWTYT